jgi:16S rRNA (guanine1207-N2)-methyltransferase
MVHEHYYTENPSSEELRRTINFNIGPRSLNFVTSSGVFSPKRIDPATRLLITHCLVPSCGKILDMGCAYGAVGITLASLNPETELIMIEINERAVSLARENISLNGLRNVRIMQGDFLEQEFREEFDVILTNPPMAAGMKTNFALIERSKELLKPTGSFQLVARHNKGGSRLEAKMEEVFGNVETLAKKGGFRVYMSIRSK